MIGSENMKREALSFVGILRGTIGKVLSMFVTSVVASLVIGICVAIAFVAVFFSRVRADGIPLLRIACLSTGVLVNPIVFFLMARGNTHWRRSVLAVIPWVCFAAYGTYDTYKGPMFDDYALMWVARGWVSVLAATVSGVLTVWEVGRKIHEKSPI